MKYFVTSDIHSFFTIFKQELNSKGFDINNPEHYLIICGDYTDRGKETRKLIDFLLSIPEDRLLLVKGNHEWLMKDCLSQLSRYEVPDAHHFSNGTIDTICQLHRLGKTRLLHGEYDFLNLRKNMEPYFKLVNRAKNYIEIGDYIFVHGWIPHIRDYNNLKDCDDNCWKQASWLNGMEEWYNGWKLERKTIVCGHWHTSFGNYNYHNKGSGEFEKDSDFSPFIDNGIIALDACTAYTKLCNIIVIDGENV